MRERYEAEQRQNERLESNLNKVRGDLESKRTSHIRILDKNEELTARIQRQANELPLATQQRLVMAILPALDMRETVASNLRKNETLDAAALQDLLDD